MTDATLQSKIIAITLTTADPKDTGGTKVKSRQHLLPLASWSLKDATQQSESIQSTISLVREEQRTVSRIRSNTLAAVPHKCRLKL